MCSFFLRRTSSDRLPCGLPPIVAANWAHFSGGRRSVGHMVGGPQKINGVHGDIHAELACKRRSVDGRAHALEAAHRGILLFYLRGPRRFCPMLRSGQTKAPVDIFRKGVGLGSIIAVTCQIGDPSIDGNFFAKTKASFLCWLAVQSSPHWSVEKYDQAGSWFSGARGQHHARTPRRSGARTAGVKVEGGRRARHAAFMIAGAIRALGSRSTPAPDDVCHRYEDLRSSCTFFFEGPEGPGLADCGLPSVRIGQRYRHDVVMHEACAFIVIREDTLVL
ncbi:hypothetical protein EDB87DRAFT_811994 [Lactarius vividus]|nr:hypothetical protein EDB87DRAFT_811994 [Lactarius vividus]